MQAPVTPSSPWPPKPVKREAMSARDKDRLIGIFHTDICYNLSSNQQPPPRPMRPPPLRPSPPPPPTPPASRPVSTGGSMLWRIVKLTVCILLLRWTGSDSFVLATSPGAMSPNEIKIGIGDSANISCTIFENGKGNSTLLWFKVVNRENKSKDKIREIRQPSEYIRILNTSTAVISIQNATEFVGVYECMKSSNLIGTTELQVGTPPKMIDKLSCLVYNYEKMRCSFTPLENKILTQYSLFYKLNDSSSEYINNCTLTEDDTTLDTWHCDLEPGNYLPRHEVYNMKLIASNVLGTTTKIFYKNCSEIVVPAKVNVIISNVTTDSVTFSWTVINFSEYRPYNGLVYEIRVKPYNSDWSDTIYNCSDCNCSLTWRNLYAFYDYEVLVRAKATTSKSEESMWSAPYVGRFKTKSRPPDKSPNTAVNAFYSKSNETRLYWQALAVNEKNGPHFEYIIEQPNGTLLRTLNTSISVPAPSNGSASYYIRVKNAAGDSPNASLIRIFHEADCGDFVDPRLIAKINENYKYELSWLPPKSTDELNDYTVFWCQAEAIFTECVGNIHFETVNRNVTNFTIPAQNHRLNLAVAANYNNCSTGMQWTRCEASASSKLGTLEPEVNAVNASAIKIRWSLEFICPSILAGYNISYCQVSKQANLLPHRYQNCSSPMISISRMLSNSEKALKMYTIGKLKPFTQYRIEMRMLSQNTQGPVSQALFVETKEAAPSAPESLEIESSVTHNSVNISWRRPALANGRLRGYKVFSVNKTKDSPRDISLLPVELRQVVQTDGDAHTRIFCQLTNLMSYSEYTIYVTAYTVEESPSSNSITFFTLIGTPTNPLNVNSKDDHDYRVLSWSKPMYPAGRVEFYEVAMWIKHKDMETGNYTEEKKMAIVVGERICRYKAPKCIDPSYSFSIEVRAVNVASKDEMQDGKVLLGTIKIARRRRHTSPEISSMVMGGIQSFNYSDIDTERHSRAEYLEGTMTAVSTIPNLNSIAGHSIEPTDRDDGYIIDETFMCENLPFTKTHHSNFVKHLLSHKQHKNEQTHSVFLHSPWQKASVQISCSESSPQRILTLTVLSVSIVVTLLLLVLTHHLYKMFNKMKNIEAVLPEGLVDHLSNYKFDIGDGFGDISSAGQVKYGLGETTSISRSIDCVMFGQKEKVHHLLTDAHDSSVNALDSLTPSSSDSKGSCEEHIEQLEPHSFGDDSNEEQSLTQSTDTVELNDVTSTTLDRATTLPSKTPLISSCDYEVNSDNATAGGYVTPSAMLTCPGNTVSARYTDSLTPNVINTTQTTPSGYVASQALAMLSASHRLQQRQQQAPIEAVTSTGYTTLDALTSPTITNSTIIDNIPAPIAHSVDPDMTTDDEPRQLILPANKNTETDVTAAIAYEIINNNNNSNKLSNGYVTQRQLSELGHLLH